MAELFSIYVEVLNFPFDHEVEHSGEIEGEVRSTLLPSFFNALLLVNAFKHCWICISWSEGRLLRLPIIYL